MGELSVSIQHISKCYQLGETVSGRRIRDLFSSAGRRRVASAAERNKYWALRDISFDVREGDVVGIIGRNGAGKSTLLKVLSRITEPTSGQIVTWGRVSSLLEVGTGFHPELTGRENVFLNGVILGMTRQEVRSRFDEIVAFAGVEKFVDTPVKRYSSGMRVRLAFAVAAHLESEILIVDEVLAVGDAEFQKRSLGKMEDIASRGRTVLFVSHDMGTIRKLCKRGVLLDRGAMAFEGGIEDAIHRYLELHSADAVPDSSELSEGETVGGFRTLREDGSECRSFGHDEPVTLEFMVKDSSDHGELSFGVQLCALPSMSKIFFDRYRSPSSTGPTAVRMTIPADLLVPGEYVFNAGASSFSGEVLGRHDGVARFRVIDRGTGLSGIKPSEIGQVLVRCRWQHTQQGRL